MISQPSAWMKARKAETTSYPAPTTSEKEAKTSGRTQNTKQRTGNSRAKDVSNNRVRREQYPQLFVLSRGRLVGEGKGEII